MIVGELSATEAEKLMDRIGGRHGLEKLLSGEWIAGEPGAVADEAPGELVEGLLQVTGDPVAAPAVTRFVASDGFAPGGELAISLLGEDFTANFLGLVEEDVPAAALRQYVLVESSIDAPIFAALGGQDTARIALAHVYAFLKTANRSKWFFFYVADLHGALWAIDAYWRDHGWDIESYSVTYPRGWRGGGRVVSR